MKRYYFDFAAATPVDPEVFKAMRPYWSKVYGNPSALHWLGQEASAAIFESRNKIAQILGCHYREIIFTGSATEANNLALRGIVKGIKNPKIITSVIEHESVLETCKDLEQEGVEVVYLPVNKKGLVDLEKFKKSLDEQTILVSVMYANNEIGTIQPVLEIVKIIQDFKKQKSNPNSHYPLFHSDAAQAFNYLDCKVNALGIDLLTISSQKIYGPKGAGLLYYRDLKINSSKLKAIITGGKQEWGLRSGTENVAGIVGLGKAVEIADRLRLKETKRLKSLQNYFFNKLRRIVPEAKLNGDQERRLPNNLNLYFPGNIGQDLLIKLDLAGFAVSPGAACAARTCVPSHVLKAEGYSDERAVNSLRISFGRPTTKKEIEKLLAVIKNVVKK